ncbi:MAG: hypothetical protein KF788_14510 [Piscinibacter sp.]|nr:hypothetical protein [Piscinibacter sp.]
MSGFLRIFVPLAILDVAVAGFILAQSLRSQAEREVQALRHSTEVAVASLSQSLAPLLRHLQSLSGESAIVDAIDSPDDGAALDQMSRAFNSLLSRNPSYAQARWIDQEGRERVRVDAGGAGRPPVRVRDPDLQAKSSRYYVRDALPLSAGTIYISELDLNVEHGGVELPPRPMLRAAIRVDARDARPAGLIVINVEGRSLLESLDQYQADQPSRRLLVNRRGDFLRGAGEADDFAFMFGRSATLAAREPELWRQMLAAEAGSAHAGNALWAWRMFSPVPNMSTNDGRNATPWFVVAWLPAEMLQPERWRAIGVTAGVGLLGLAVIGALTLRVVREKALLEKETERAERAARAKAEFLANMSHEIRTPINAIVGLTYLMSRDARDPDLRARLGKVDAAARHLLQVINDILDLSKIDAGKLVVESVAFELDQVLQGAMDMVRLPAQKKGLELVLDCSLPGHLRGDPTRLSQALINLLGNAVKFTERGWVRLRPSAWPKRTLACASGSR